MQEAYLPRRILSMAFPCGGEGTLFWSWLGGWGRDRVGMGQVAGWGYPVLVLTWGMGEGSTLSWPKPRGQAGVGMAWGWVGVPRPGPGRGTPLPAWTDKQSEHITAPRTSYGTIMKGRPYCMQYVLILVFIAVLQVRLHSTSHRWMD